jgi:hypothetical protein
MSEETQSPADETNAAKLAKIADMADPIPEADKQQPASNDTPAANADAPPATPPKKGAKAKTPAAPGLVKFVSTDPDVKVLLGADRDVQFDNGVAFVTPEIAEVLSKHHLYVYDHISRADEVIRINGRMISFKGDPGFREQVAEAARDGKVVFYLDAPQRTSIPLGDVTINFDSRRAVVSKKVAERLRRHRFFVENRLIEVTQE